MVGRFQHRLQTKKAWEEGLGHSLPTNGHEKPMNSRGASSDTASEGERMEQKDQFCSVVHMVTRSWH